MKKLIIYFTATILVVFGLITLFLSTSIMFDLFGVRAQEGNYVPIVIWANFISSILYLISGYGLVKHKKWTAKYLLASAVVLGLAYVGLLLHINAGELYEVKTLWALAFRIGFTLVMMSIAYYTINRSSSKIVTAS